MKHLPMTLWLRAAGPAMAVMLDNEAGRYLIAPQPGAGAEAGRLDRMQQVDQVPLGRQIAAGQTLVATLEPGAGSVSLVIGFRRFWNGGEGQQPVDLHPGQNVITAERSGPIHVRHEGAPGAPEAALTLHCGKPLPLYVDGQTTPLGWAAELDAYRGAGIVQLVSARSLITLPRAVYDSAPMRDPVATFVLLDQIQAWSDDLAGLDGSTAPETPSPLRQRYLVDLTTRPGDPFWMYATDGFIGLRPENAADLTDPALLAQSWGIWHETGHV